MIRPPFHGNNFHQWNQPHQPPHHNYIVPPRSFRQHEPTQIWEEFYCETCDRGFRTKMLLENHKTQHQKCNIDGCQFIAHPKVITKHIQMQHSSGLYKKIAKLSNPEEIQKWIEERKKKYPTKSNIDKKAAEVKEKTDRGEKIGLKQEKHFRNNKGHKFSKVFSQHHSNYNNRTGKTKFQKKPMVDNKKYINSSTKIKPFHEGVSKCNITAVECKGNLKPFGGIQDIIMDCEASENEDLLPNNLIEDDEMDTPFEPSDNVTNGKPTVCAALSSLINDYGSSDDEEQVKLQNNLLNTAHKSIQTQKPANQEQKVEATAKIDEDSGPEEVKVDKTVVEHETEKSPHTKVPYKHANTEKKLPKIVHSRFHPYNKLRPKLPSTLLEKLLRREIQQERNLVLQCIRFIVKNNFFDVK